MNTSRFKSIFRILMVVIALISMLGSSLGVTPAQAAESRGLPLEQLLNQDGTLNLTTGYNGNLDIDNYSVSLDPQYGPLFRPLAIAGTWSALGATPLNDVVEAIAVSGTDVYAGGSFTDAGGDANADYIARFNGTSWSALGTIPLNDVVDAIAVSGTDVYAGGSFTDAGGDANADYIARFDGTSWSALGATPLSGNVTDIALSGTDVYAGGTFDNAGGDANADKVARFNGTSWSPLGATPLNSSVRAIAVSGANVYVGGLFTNAGGDANADYIARFNGTSWSALGGTPLSNLVNTIAVSGTDVYAGGNFLDAGGDANADRVARFNGTSWSALGATPFGGIVYAITVSGTDVYVGGSFLNVGGNGNSDFIARFNGTSWSPLGATPLSANVTAIAILSGTQVYAGGGFTNAGGSANADYIAKFTVSPAKAITAFNFTTPAATGAITESNHTIAVTVPYGTNVTALTPTITHTGASVSPNSGVAQNFTNPVIYTVTAADSSTQTYTVTVTVALNPAKAITAFNFASPSATGVVTESNHTIAITVPYGTNVTALVPTITHTGASVSPNSGVAQNFTNPVIYTVTAADSSTQPYTVTVTVALNPAKAITAFNFTSPSATGVVTESSHTIAITVPYGTNVTALVPTITHTGASVSPNSGVAQDFTNPVTYTVTAADSSTQSYTVTVTVALNPAKAITVFNFASPAVTGVVTEASHTIAITVPYGTDVTALVPSITHSGASVSPNSGVAQDFTNPVTYTVTAADTSTQAYTVTVTVAANPAKAITAFNFANPAAIGVVTEASHAIAITVPYGTNVTALVPTITHTGASVKPNSGVAQDFTNSVIYTVTAADSSSQDYLVTVVTPPAVTLNQASGQSDPDFANSVSKNIHFTAVFSEPVTGFTASDISFAGTTLMGTLSATVTEIAPMNGTTYDVGVRGMLPKGTVFVSIPVNKATSIAHGLGNEASTSTDNNIIVDYVLVEFTSTASKDGWVLESTETSGMGSSLDSTATTSRVGDDASDRQYRSLIDFATGSLPDSAVLFSVNLRVIEHSITGANPFATHGLLKSEIKSGFFGTAGALQTPDFEDAPDKSACNFETVPEIIQAVGTAYRCILFNSAFPYINLTGSTQFKLRFATDDNDDMSVDTFNFYSSDYGGATQRPRLFVKYYISPMP